jgi:formamidopyrimidine-DNA glycosylase
LSIGIDMPELPEVEHLRRTLAARIIGMRIEELVEGPHDVLDRSQVSPSAPRTRLLLLGATVVELRRRGKHLAIISSDGRVLGLHLGMSGRVTFHAEPDRSDRHAHLAWLLGGRLEGRLGGHLPAPSTADAHQPAWCVFRDPRRFGGLTAWASPKALDDAWARLGPDALETDASILVGRLRGLRRQAKAALLDQSLLAGVGNIYADEGLFRARLHPNQRLDRVSDAAIVRLVEGVQAVMSAAVDSGGSSLRDYVDADARSGSYQDLHLVYGRAGSACPICERTLRSRVTAGRTTVFCPDCQRLIHNRRSARR